MDKSDLKSLKKIANELKPIFHLGKSGLTPSFLKMVDDYLQVHNIVKIKVSIAEDKDSSNTFADLCAKELDALVIDKKGFTFTLYKKEF